jgi:SNF2 family DNA or RNA helicase
LAVNRIESVARIILTGYPLQNRLEEYYCMVDFVRPNFLGEYNTFRNLYVRPILAGLYPDSSPFEIKVTLGSVVFGPYATIKA